MSSVKFVIISRVKCNAMINVAVTTGHDSESSCMKHIQTVRSWRDYVHTDAAVGMRALYFPREGGIWQAGDWDCLSNWQDYRRSRCRFLVCPTNRIRCAASREWATGDLLNRNSCFKLSADVIGRCTDVWDPLEPDVRMYERVCGWCIATTSWALSMRTVNN